MSSSYYKLIILDYFMKKFIKIVLFILVFGFLSFGLASVASAGDWHQDEDGEETGSITVCKIVLDEQGNSIAGGEGTTFTVPFVDEDYEGEAEDVPGDVEFTPALDQDNVFGSYNGECYTVEDLDFGRYYYGEEEISPENGWETPLYNDGASGEPSDLSDFGEFNTNLDESYDDFDGVINISEGNPDRTLIVVNQLVEEEEPDTATIVATKIVCDSEEDLPNWGEGGEDITENTASNFLENNENCQEEDWTFEWAGSQTENPGDNQEVGGDPWTSFSGNVTVPAGDLVWVREQLPDGYIPFSGDTESEDGWDEVSAEFYCSNDVLNYDNYDFINPVEEGETYYCVGFNVPTETQNSCPVPDTLQDETEEEVNEAPDGEEDLQDILDSEGYGVDVQDDQKQYQLWNVDSGNEVTINAAFIAEYAGNNSVFGYYKDGDLNTFVGIFRTGDVPAPYDGLPLGTSGPFNVNTGGADTIGFAIKTYSGDSLAGTFATENALNPNSSDQVVVYNPEAGKYVLAFEDIEGEGSDYDYNDLVVEITLDCEDLETPPPPPPECSDNVDNADPEDELADELDPGCHTDGDANNENSYDPNDDDETDEAVEPPECSDNVDNSDPEDELADELDPGCHTDGNAGNSESYNPNDDNETDEVSGDLPECSDGSDNEGDSEIDEDDPGCHDDEDANNPDSYDPNDDDETDANDIPSGGGGGGSGGRSSRSSGQVLGAETPALCNWTVDTYMRRGYRNNAEQVKVLQEFLNWYMHSGLVVDGLYGPRTEAAVRAFQVARADNILKPWRLTSSTGIFYKTTLVEAKNLMCPQTLLPVPTDLVNWSQNSAQVPTRI